MKKKSPITVDVLNPHNSLVFTTVLGFSVAQILKFPELTDPRNMKWTLSDNNTLDNQSSSAIF